MRSKFALLPLALIVLVLVLIPASAVLSLPGERPVKEFFGIQWNPPCAEAQPRAGTPWRPEPRLPWPVDETRGAVDGTRIYFAGGTRPDGDPSREFAVLDTATGRFTTLPDEPEAGNHQGLAVLGGDVYLAGGFGADLERFPASAKAWRYDTAERRWQAIAPMHQPRGGHGLVAAGGLLYAIGGRHLRNSLSSVESFDPATGRWSERAPMPTPRDHVGVTVLDGLVYAVGGRQARGGDVAAVERYDPRSDRWERLADFPERRSGIGVAAAEGHLVATGGETIAKPLTVSDRVWELGPGGGAWSRLPNLPTPLHGHASTGIGDRVYTFAGSTCAGFGVGRNGRSLEIAR